MSRDRLVAKLGECWRGTAETFTHFDSSLFHWQAQRFVYTRETVPTRTSSTISGPKRDLAGAERAGAIWTWLMAQRVRIYRLLYFYLQFIYYYTVRLLERVVIYGDRVKLLCHTGYWMGVYFFTSTVYFNFQYENDIPAHYPGPIGGMDGMYDSHRTLPNHPALHQSNIGSGMHQYPPYTSSSSMPGVSSSQDSQLKRDKDSIYGYVHVIFVIDPAKVYSRDHVQPDTLRGMIVTISENTTPCAVRFMSTCY